ncbi:MAG TPA: N-6 DNA methylase [Candidatus Tectomicrobia bacterium]|nr:N-6 DNA methylase [Candidatus Tectomicrobia bacterium]
MPTQARKKPPPQTTKDYLVTLEHAIRTLSYGHHTFTIFRHFVELSALALSNVADPSNKAAREAQYLAIVKQYTPEEVQQFPPMFGMLVACLEQETTDVLGMLYHRLALHNHQSGQFFTPYPLCQVMAKMLVHDAKRLGEHHEYIRAHEPCVGSGAMVIALTQALREEGINYHHKLHVTAIDIDTVAVSMAYVQCTLLHILALICHGDTLTGEVYSVWRTFAHVMGFWDARLARDRRTLPAPQKDPLVQPVAPTADVLTPPLPTTPPPRSRRPQPPSGQLTLF